MRFGRTVRAAFPWIVCLAAALVYLRTMAPTVEANDAGELQVLGWALGIPHGTGYPLYIWLAGLFARIPTFDQVAPRVTLLSVVAGAGCVGMLVLVTRRLFDGGHWPTLVGATIGAAFCARACTFWSVAITSEMYSLQLLFAMSLVLLLLRIEELSWAPWLAAILLGAMFGNHVTTVGLVPGALAFLLVSRRRAAPGLLLRFSALAAASVAVFNLFLFWLLWRRAVPFDQFHSVIEASHDQFGLPMAGQISFWRAWFFTVTCRQFGAALMNAPTAFRLLQGKLIPFRFVAELGPVACSLALLGWLQAWRADARRNLGLTLLLIVPCWLSTTYAATSKTAIYLLVPQVLLCAYAGAALGRVGEAVLARAPRRAVFAQLGAATLLLVAWAGRDLGRVAYADYVVQQGSAWSDALLPSMGAHPDRSTQTWAYQGARQIADELPQNAIVFTDWYWKYPLEYVLRVERGIHTVQVFEARPYPATSLPRSHIDRILSAHVPVFFAGSSVSELVRDPRFAVRARGSSLWEVSSPLGAVAQNEAARP